MGQEGTSSFCLLNPRHLGLQPSALPLSYCPVISIIYGESILKCYEPNIIGLYNVHFPFFEFVDHAFQTLLHLVEVIGAKVDRHHIFLRSVLHAYLENQHFLTRFLITFPEVAVLPHPPNVTMLVNSLKKFHVKVLKIRFILCMSTSRAGFEPATFRYLQKEMLSHFKLP